MNRLTRTDKTALQRLSEDPRTRAHVEGASIQIGAAELLDRAFRDSGINKTRLAEFMDVSRARASQIFDAEPHNFTLELLGRAAGAMGLSWRLALMDFWTNETKYSIDLPPIGRSFEDAYDGAWRVVRDDGAIAGESMTFVGQHGPASPLASQPVEFGPSRPVSGESINLPLALERKAS